MSNESTPYKPKTLAELLRWKQLGVYITRDDVFVQEEDPEWFHKHKLGPVHSMIRCKLCDAILFRDLKEFGWLGNESFYTAKLHPHLEQHK